MPELNVNFRQIQTAFQDLDPKLDDKHLRFDEDRGLHLHDSGKWSGIGAKAAQSRALKHSEAFDTVAKSIDQQLGTTGMGEQILRGVLSERAFDEKLIKVSDLQRIGAMVEDVRQNRIDSVLYSISNRTENPALLDKLRARLENDESIDLVALGQSLRTGPPLSDYNAKALLWELDRTSTGLHQMLAKYDLIDTFVHHNKRTGLDVHWAVGRDQDGLCYAGITSREKSVRGTRYETDPFRGFYTVKSLDFHAKLDSGEIKEVQDKVHLSVNKNEIGRAWNTVLPILMKYPDVVQQFKVTDMEQMERDLEQYEVELGSLRMAPMGPGETQEQRSAKENDLQKKIDGTRRVVEGAQITLYFHSDRDDKVQTERAKQMLTEINVALTQENIEPGDVPESDLGLDRYSSYRYDYPGMDPDGPQREQMKKDMLTKPVFQALKGQ